ncbi:MAG: hypothetical protein KDE34_15455, partial [Anaerolineales bacterium]|nr:hypothetical protein [Anaerolineales bacterium]
MSHNEKKDDKKNNVPEFTPEMPTDQAVTTQHQFTIGGQTLSYTATAGNIVLKEEDGKPKATIFYIAYTLDGVENLADRPLTFSFNGGPGS